jgi:hypothetical protein
MHICGTAHSILNELTNLDTACRPTSDRWISHTLISSIHEYNRHVIRYIPNTSGFELAVGSTVNTFFFSPLTWISLLNNAIEFRQIEATGTYSVNLLNLIDETREHVYRTCTCELSTCHLQLKP